MEIITICAFCEIKKGKALVASDFRKHPKGVVLSLSKGWTYAILASSDEPSGRFILVIQAVKAEFPSKKFKFPGKKLIVSWKEVNRFFPRKNFFLERNLLLFV